MTATPPPSLLSLTPRHVLDDYVPSPVHRLVPVDTDAAALLGTIVGNLRAHPRIVAWSAKGTAVRAEVDATDPTASYPRAIFDLHIWRARAEGRRSGALLVELVMLVDHAYDETFETLLDELLLL